MKDCPTDARPGGRVRSRSSNEALLQAEIEAKGLEIFARTRGATPHVFSHGNLMGRLMEWSMKEESRKIQLFRLVDVLPALNQPRDVARHAWDYLASSTDHTSTWLRCGLRTSRQFPWLLALAARAGVAQMARNFILAPTAAAAPHALERLRAAGLAFTIDVLGERAVCELEAERYQARYAELIESLAREARAWPRLPRLDCDDQGDLSKVNLSIKISALYSQIQPADPDGAIHHLASRLRPLFRLAKENHVFLNFDMEHYALKDLTFDLFYHMLDDPEFTREPAVGLAVQAYLPESEQDLARLVAWARARGRRLTVRLIKGAYWDFETLLARQRNWSIPVFQSKAETDARFERLTRFLLQQGDVIQCAIGTHNVRSIAHCLVQAQRLGRAPNSFEIQMLYGMAEPIKQALIQMGYRVREYCPIGETLPGMSYLVRRLLENTSNEGFLRSTFQMHARPLDLLKDPAGLVAASPRPRPASPPAFQNEPRADFTRRELRLRMQAALASVKSSFGNHYPLSVNDRPLESSGEIVSLNPARPHEIVGCVAKAGKEQAEAAVQAALAAWPDWRRRPGEERAALLEKTAEILSAERFTLSAWEVFEVGKTWPEADADVTEAIDFCRFYALQMRRLAARHVDVPGESNLHAYLPRGVGVVIAPWNFPLAILCGMTAAMLVTGNCALIKPSEQSSVIAAHFFHVLQRAGFPPGVMAFVPGRGEEVGRYLVEHPSVALIAFTGSKEVGLRIREAAGKVRSGQQHLKKVVCEMGGKNAAIVDADADLDLAIPAIVHSAFGYQGQKCSALSRLIVLKSIYQKTLDRLIEAARGLAIGFPEHPGTFLGPVIDRPAYERIWETTESGKREAHLAFQGEAPAGEGYFIPPVIFDRVPPSSRIAREEIFGPVLSVLQAANLDQAIALANDSEFALTGGLFSRGPEHIRRVQSEFLVGNLYINRGITGALVGRQPFGGFKMSGGGTQAGGPEYLLHFLHPRTVTENTIRRGFAPTEGREIES